jgi:hypothetical protein
MLGHPIRNDSLLRVEDNAQNEGVLGGERVVDEVYTHALKRLIINGMVQSIALGLGGHHGTVLFVRIHMHLVETRPPRKDVPKGLVYTSCRGVIAEAFPSEYLDRVP